MRRKVFITGATGLVGGYFLSRIADRKDIEPILLVRAKNQEEALKRISGLANYFSSEHDFSNIKVYCGDLTLPNLGLSVDELSEVKDGLTDIFHSAAEISFDDSRNAGKTSDTNINGTKIILDCFGKNRNFFYVSTAYISGDWQKEFKETDIDVGQNFKNDYEKSKFKAENEVRRFFGENSDKLTVLRPSIVLGEYDNGRTFQFESFYKVLFLIKRFAERHSNQDLSFVYNPHSTQNYIPVDFLTDLIEEIFMFEENWGKTYHLANDCPLTNLKMGELFLRILHVHIQNRPAQNRDDRFFYKMTSKYQPYLQGEAIFDCSNRNRLKSSKKNALFTKEYFDRLMEFSVKANWGE